MIIENYNSDIKLFLKAEKNKIKTLQANEFEAYIADLFQKLGFNATLTPSTNDGGKDIVITKDDKTYYVECKHFSEGLVGREIVQKLVGAAIIDGNVDGFIVATSSYFNANAIECAKKNNHIILLDLDDIISLIEYQLIKEKEVAISQNDNSLIVGNAKTLKGYDLQVQLDKKSSCVVLSEYNFADKLVNSIKVPSNQFLKLLNDLKELPVVLDANNIMNSSDMPVTLQKNSLGNDNAIGEKQFKDLYILIHSDKTNNFYLYKNNISLAADEKKLVLEFDFATNENNADTALVTRAKCVMGTNTIEELSHKMLNIKTNRRSFFHTYSKVYTYSENSVLAHCIYYILKNLRAGNAELVSEVLGKQTYNLINPVEFN